VLDECRDDGRHDRSQKSFREFIIGPTSVTGTHISTLTDSIILLRYVEVFGAVKRGSRC